ncbi:glycosyltransferase [Falsigemmobacter faecalis]|uniref:Glycosyltransferase family 1 protein n=1 Tax=Falsigemmobacter faecalis TaxID=2488730 RepID=A0A3P3D6K4_9RHOB|nr:glycosyltransferase family 1 protein [Falsigemmobacter faecalis]RRH69781.1 glycosyltransferase family 1 protein [Falsigemmobacter faecalis]
MSRRYLFLCTDERAASGGTAVIYDTVAVLGSAGYDAALVHNSPNAGYHDHPDRPRKLYSQDYARARMAFEGRRARVTVPLRLLRDRLRGGVLDQWEPGAGDVLVVPEYMIAAAMLAFPQVRMGVYVQNTFAFERAHNEAMALGLDIRQRAEWFLGVSQICLDQFELMGIRTGHALRVTMKPEEFPFQEEKEALITYMPRKRPAEARQIAESLERRGKLQGYRLLALDNMPRLEVSQQLQRSRFFISLLHQESIGFPAAEAMAAGCIVVGYTGLGGREFFTPETGIPVTEDDTLRLVQALEAAVTEYAAAPARLEALRRHASEVVNASYGRATFEASLLDVWRRIDTGTACP